MIKEKILIIGASGQLGVELTLALRGIYGSTQVIAADLRKENELLAGTGPFVYLDVLQKEQLYRQIVSNGITQIYQLAAVLSVSAENTPLSAWQLNMQGLLNVLEIAREVKIGKIFWPSSIAVFGATSPKESCSQHTIIEPMTAYGISKYAGECWCQYYFKKYGVDVRSLRYPGLVSYKAPPCGGTTDYAIELFNAAHERRNFTCFLERNSMLPMMYMPDAIRSAVELMEAPAENIHIRMAYNVAAMSFTPADLAFAIANFIPDFTIQYQPDYRQNIADSWPDSIDDREARKDWKWMPAYDLNAMTRDMLMNMRSNYLVGSEKA